MKRLMIVSAIIVVGATWTPVFAGGGRGGGAESGGMGGDVLDEGRDIREPGPAGDAPLETHPEGDPDAGMLEEGGPGTAGDAPVDRPGFEDYPDPGGMLEGDQPGRAGDAPGGAGSGQGDPGAGSGSMGSGGSGGTGSGAGGGH